MKNTLLTPVIILILFVLLPASCSPTPSTPAPMITADISSPDEAPAPTERSDSSGENPAGMANPASVFCQEQGYKNEIRTAADGSQSGVCIFSDGSECDEWAYFRGECAAPGTSSSGDSTAPIPVLEITPQLISLPVGVLLNPMAEPGLSLYSPIGDVLGDWITTLPTPVSNVHLAGPAASDVVNAPLVFASMENGVTGLKVSQAGKISDLFDFPSGVIFTDLIGAPGSPWVVYTVIEPQEDGSSLVSKLYAGRYDQLSTVQPALVDENKESRILKPVAVRMDGGAPHGVWYTYTLFGIGGDSFTAPHAGLYYLDLASGKTREYLSSDKHFSSLSPDQTHAAWTPDLPDAAMTLTDLVGGGSISFPLLQNHERGAVHAHISPDNTKIAWMEGSGNAFDGTLQATLRVGTSDGIVTGEYPDEVFAGASGLDDGASIQAVGWLDNQTLLVQSYLPGKEGNGAVIRLDVITGKMTSLASGIFTAFGYP